MQQLTFSYSPNDLQKFFVEKGLELLYKDTLDSYRLRLHNPKTAIEELVSVTQYVKDGVLERTSYVREVSKEVKKLIEKDDGGLSFHSVNKDYYKRNILENSKAENYNKIIQSSKLLLRDNADYAISLLDRVKVEIDEYVAGSPIDNRRGFVFYFHYSLIELINRGFSKQYLYEYFRAIFVHTGESTLTFDDRYEIWKELFNQEDRQYTVIYSILGQYFQFRELHKIDAQYKQVNKAFRRSLPPETSTRVRSFLEAKKQEKLVAIQINAKDHYTAIRTSRVKLSVDLDLYHLGFSGITNKIDQQTAVISQEDPSKGSTAPSNYQLDGYTRGGIEIFSTLLEKVDRLDTNDKVSMESKDKLTAGFRYLRLGSEAPELEAKLLNYWIGLEYVFTSFLSDDKTIDRIHSYFPSCHSLIYIRRNLYEFHKALKRMEINDRITDFDENLLYLKKYRTYEEVKNATDSMLLYQRANELQKWAENPNEIKKSLESHKNNLLWNISRIYRIRNEIVHNAATKSNISANVSHIKYYLTFILNSMLDFLSEYAVDVNNDGKVTIEDYLISQDIMFGALKGSTIEKYIQVHNPLEILH